VDELRKNWLVILFSGVISAAISLTLLSLTFKKEDSKELKKEIDSKAPYEYVDKQDAQIRSEIKNHQEEDKQREEITQKWMQSIDAKLNILIQKK